MADTDELVNPMQLFDIEMEPEVPSQRVRRPTKRALAMIEDSLPEGPGVLQSDNKDSGVVTPEARPRSPLRIRIRRILKTAANKFGLVRTYHGRPSTVPQSHRVNFLADDAPLPTSAKPMPAPSSPEQKTVKDIIHPYPNISAFLFNRFHCKEDEKKAAKNSFKTFFCMTISTLTTFEMWTLIV